MRGAVLRRLSLARMGLVLVGAGRQVTVGLGSARNGCGQSGKLGQIGCGSRSVQQDVLWRGCGGEHTKGGGQGHRRQV